MLVTDHGQLFPFASQPQNRSQKILAADVVHPGRAQDDVSASGGGDGLLARQLGLTVNVERAG